MPNMNGLDFLEKIMRLRPMPVIMVSTLTQRGAEATIAALEIGAFDCVGKPGPGDMRPFAELIDKSRPLPARASITSTRAGVSPRRQPQANANTAAEYKVGRKIVAIGSSRRVASRR